MNILEFARGELSGWGKYERILFPLEILFITLISIYMKDKTAALISAICGICATITAGKGKISCYFFGMISNICYSYISFKTQLWGHLCLNMLYYFPMQFLGIAKWKKHMKKDKQEIYKTKLSAKERIIYSIFGIITIIILYFALKYFGDSNSIMDSITTVLSVIAFILTVKRCIEQWYLWTVVNGLCIIIWINAYLSGSHCFATILMWGTYFILGLYFLHNWNREIKNEPTFEHL